MYAWDNFCFLLVVFVLVQQVVVVVVVGNKVKGKAHGCKFIRVLFSCKRSRMIKEERKPGVWWKLITTTTI